ncbi:MAG: 50S ribosomal protein L21 [Fidelibacterota bacterium]
MKSEMYAIAEIAGDQVVLESGKKVAVPRLSLEEGQEYVADSILYYRNGDEVKIGNPTVKDLKISTIVVAQPRLPKVIVFKKKRRKGYKVKKGHRQPYTLLEVKEVKAVKKQSVKSKAATTPEKKTETAAANE